jgi:hypothetical protein
MTNLNTKPNTISYLGSKKKSYKKLIAQSNRTNDTKSYEGLVLLFMGILMIVLMFTAFSDLLTPFTWASGFFISMSSIIVGSNLIK